MKLKCYTVIWTYEQYTHIHPNQAHQTLHFPKIDNVYSGLQESLQGTLLKNCGKVIFSMAKIFLT